MTTHNYGASAGVGEARFTKTYQIFWGDERKRLLLTGIVSGSVRDPNSGNTYIVRPGNMLGKRDADGHLVMYDPNGSDGSQNFKGILGDELFMVNPRDFSDEDKTDVNVAVSAPVQATEILIGGVPLIGHPDETAARAVLANHFILDDLLN